MKINPEPIKIFQVGDTFVEQEVFESNTLKDNYVFLVLSIDLLTGCMTYIYEYYQRDDTKTTWRAKALANTTYCVAYLDNLVSFYKVAFDDTD